MALVRSKTSIPIVADFIAGGGTDIICDTTAGIAYFLNGLNVVVPIGANYAYSDEQVRDTVAAAFAAGTQTGLIITYDDPNDKFSFTVPVAERRNFIINGGFDVWQRGSTIVNSSTTSNFYTADRWPFNRSGDVAGTTISIGGSPGIGTRQSLVWQRTPGNASTAAMACYYALDSADSITLSQRAVTLSFWAGCGVTYSGGVLSALLNYGTGTDQREYAFTGITTISAVNCTLPVSDWQKFSVTGTIPNAATQVGLQLSWNPTGVAGATDYIFMTAFQLEIGSVATDYVGRPIAQELAICQRYYEKSFPYPTAPATAVGTAGSHFTTTQVAGALANNFPSHPRFLVPKRSTPTVTLYNPSAANSQVRNFATATDGTGASVANTSQNGFTVTSVGLAGWAVNQTVGYHWTADSEL